MTSTSSCLASHVSPPYSATQNTIPRPRDARSLAEPPYSATQNTIARPRDARSLDEPPYSATQNTIARPRDARGLAEPLTLLKLELFFWAFFVVLSPSLEIEYLSHFVLVKRQLWFCFV